MGRGCRVCLGDSLHQVACPLADAIVQVAVDFLKSTKSFYNTLLLLTKNCGISPQLPENHVLSTNQHVHGLYL